IIQIQQTNAETITNKKNITTTNTMIEKGIRNKTYTAEFGQESISFKSIFDAELQKKLQTIIQTYERVIGQEEHVNDFIITGGGSFIIGKELKEIKPKFRLLENPQLSTAT